MKKTASPNTFDRLAAHLKTVSPSRLRKLIAKDARIDFRLSETDKDAMQATAQGVGLTVSEYLVRLHYVANKKLGS